MILKEFIKEILLAEDLKNFVARTKGNRFDHDFDDPTFENDPQIKKMARQIKTIWNEEADHQFMKSLIKVHWIAYDLNKNHLKEILNSKSEISAMGYLPGTTKFESGWGDIGILIDGKVTLAANDMDDLMSGYFSGLPNYIHKKYRSSGTPKRMTKFNDRASSNYILDQNSFQSSGTGSNELIVANWKVKGIIGVVFHSKYANALKTALDLGIPIYDRFLNRVEDEVKKIYGF